MAKPKAAKSLIPKLFRDIAAYKGSNSVLLPGPDSPICRRCNLDNCKSLTPYMPYGGSEDPLITFVFEAPSRKEDVKGGFALDGPPLFLMKVLAEVSKDLNIDPARFRWTAVTRCAVVEGKGNPATGAKWCRNHLVQDLMIHRPKLIVPIGSVALGALNHKSNAQDWGGRVLTWRGWPDAWLFDPKFENGHPIFGPRPTQSDWIAMYPLQAPRIVFSTQNEREIARWKRQAKVALELALAGAPAKIYDKPWWKITSDPNEVSAHLDWLVKNPGTVVTYDTETTGLRPWLRDKIVFMMMRWDGPDGPKAIGWPWDYDNAEILRDHPELAAEFGLGPSPMLPYLASLAPKVLEALKASKLRGHNLTFDLLFTIATLPGGLSYLNALCEAFHQDTWHMRYCLRQERGSIGLEIVAYDWCPDLAGYEEEMTLMIERYADVMSPEKGGHYANCPQKYWDTHFRPYVMGDVEVCHVAAQNMEKKLEASKRYAIPLACDKERGKFRKFTPPNRDFVYKNILRPSGSMLAKLMARGMYVDPDELSNQESIYPRMIFEARAKLRQSDPRLATWCDAQEAADPEWEFDLENKKILKSALFGVLELPVRNLTDAGTRQFKDVSRVPKELLVDFASTDKFSINALAVDFPQVRPLLEYRTLHKAYTSYVRPMRNITVEGIDKNPRKSDPILMLDGCVHANFKLAGTRGGRLACTEPNLQQVPRDGMIKRLYASRFGKHRGIIYQGDLSQIELRLLAAACGDPTMVKAYWDGIDLHSLTTSNVFKIPYEHFGEEYEIWLQKNGRSKEAKGLKTNRKIGKTLNFLTGYGGGALGFQSALALQGIYITLEEAERHLEGFFETYPFLKTHLSYYKRFIQDSGVAVSITGRVRILEEVFSNDPQTSNKALRAGYNHLIQSTASDMMLVCLVAIEHLMRDNNLESMLVSTVHDSLVIDAVREEIPHVHEIVEYVLSNIPTVMKLMMGDSYDTSWAIVPFAGDSELGLNYLDAFKIPKGNNVDWDEVFARVDKKAA